MSLSLLGNSLPRFLGICLVIVFPVFTLERGRSILLLINKRMITITGSMNTTTINNNTSATIGDDKNGIRGLKRRATMSSSPRLSPRMGRKTEDDERGSRRSENGLKGRLTDNNDRSSRNRSSSSSSSSRSSTRSIYDRTTKATATNDDEGEEREKAKKNGKEGYAWRGDVIGKKSLPILKTGKVDYRTIDRSPVSKVLTATIRKLLVAEVGSDTDKREWTDFEALMTSVREVNDMKGTARDVQLRAKSVFKGILPALYIGWIPPLWKKFVDPNAPKWVTGYSFHLVFVTLFPWLMGPMEGAEYEDVEIPEKMRKTFTFLPKSVSLPQAIKAERCRFLETSSCASVCVNSCKVPSQEWLREDFGMNLHIQPNYDDFSCVWSFNKEPPPLEEDAAILVPCFTNCKSEFKGEKDALKQVMRVKAGVGISKDGVDKYTGDTLEAIAKRASLKAIEEATIADGTANSTEMFKDRVEKVQAGGKCWSVDTERALLR